MEKQNEQERGKIKKKNDGPEVKFEEVLSGSKESYPFGDEETKAARKVKAIYREIVARQFPELV